jgi:hypothetical protein
MRIELSKEQVAIVLEALEWRSAQLRDDHNISGQVEEAVEADEIEEIIEAIDKESSEHFRFSCNY